MLTMSYRRHSRNSYQSSFPTKNKYSKLLQGAHRMKKASLFQWNGLCAINSINSSCLPAEGTRGTDVLDLILTKRDEMVEGVEMTRTVGESDYDIFELVT